MRLVVLGDIHGELNALASVLHDSKQEYMPDAYLVVGDIGSEVLGTAAEQSGDRAALYTASVLALLSLLEQSGVPVFFVPGNRDLPDLPSRPDSVFNCDILSSGEIRALDQLQIVGIGGANRIGMWHYEWDEEEVRQRFLEIAKLAAEKPTLLLTHCPPQGSLLDLHESGAKHIGSQAVRELIQQSNPVLCVSGHVHEGVGVDVVDGCVAINAGSLVGESTISFLNEYMLPDARAVLTNQYFVVDLAPDRGSISIVRRRKIILSCVPVIPNEYLFRQGRLLLKRHGVFVKVPTTGDRNLATKHRAPDASYLTSRD